MLVEKCGNCFHVGLVKILSNNENALSLQLTDSPVENTHGLLYLSAGGGARTQLLK